MAAGWVYSKHRGEVDVIDNLWAASIGGAAAYYGAIGSAPLERHLFLVCIALLQSIRLSWHLIPRVIAIGEDHRYSRFQALEGKVSSAVKGEG